MFTNTGQRSKFIAADCAIGHSVIRSGGLWEATSFNLRDLNPVEGWCL